MTVRVFVISAALTIFCWLAATFLRAVPMDTYPVDSPAMSAVMRDASKPPIVATSSKGAGAGLVAGTSATQ